MVKRYRKKAKHYSELSQFELDRLLDTHLSEYVTDTKSKAKRSHPILGYNGFTQRIINALEGRGIYTLYDLLHAKKKDLEAIPNFGEKSVDLIFDILRRLGFYEK